MNMSGTAAASAMCSLSTARVLLNWSADVLLISVRTEDTRLINRAFMLASSRCPNPGSAAPAVQPTMMTRQYRPVVT
jgi:hypothetical protein